MEAAYVTALAALAGSVVGSATSLWTTILSQNVQRRIDRATKESDKRERLYGLFIDQATKLFGEALKSGNDDPVMLVDIGASLNRMRLIATPAVLAAAEAVIVSVIRTNAGPRLTLKDYDDELAREVLQPLQTFGEACRRELDSIS